MTTIRLPYVKYLVTPESIKPPQYVYRPVIPVKLSLRRKTIVFDGLIDSGADECTFPGWIIKTLGGNVHNGEQRIFKGIGGSVLSYRHNIHLSVGSRKFAASVYCSHEWDDMPFGLLGQAGFFSHFKVLFDYKRKQVVLT